MANNPFEPEIWWHSNANVYFRVFLGKKYRITALSGATVAQQVAAAIAEGADDKTGAAAPGNVFFLESLPEGPA